MNEKELRKQQAIRQSIPPWHVIVTEPGCDLRAFKSLVYKMVNAYMPMVRRMESMGRGEKRFVVRPMIPGYIPIHLPERFGAWDELRECVGVADFLRIGGLLATLSDDAITFLRAVEADLARPTHKRRVLVQDVRVERDDLVLGARVRMTEDAGAWAGYEAVIQALDDRDRCALEILLPGRAVRVTAPVQWMQAV